MLYLLSLQELVCDLSPIGTGSYEEIQLSYLAVNTDIQKGDILLTSGLGGQYPAGYPVAVIDKVSSSRRRIIPGSPCQALSKTKQTSMKSGLYKRAVDGVIDFE